MRRIGKYIVKGLLGKGGMAKVYRVASPVINKMVALKRLDPDPLVVDLVGEDQLREAFTREAVTMAQLRHPHITAVWDFDEDHQGHLFYIMEYYFNNLGHMIGESALPDRPSRIIRIDKAVDYACQTLDGMNRLHHADIVHRDIKPFNLLVTEQDTIKICDFGLSKIRGERTCGPSNLKVGSAWYAPPEQERAADQVDITADLFAMGVTLYRMLCGRLPLDDAPAPSSLNPDLDVYWNKFFKKAMAPHRSDRFDDVPSMQAALDELFSKWRRRADRLCRLAEPTDRSASTADDTRTVLRRHAVKVSSRQARSTFGIDELWRPQTYCRNRFLTPTGETVVDDATALEWQRAGSPFPMTWHQAYDYVRTLNRNVFAGHADWRLPTVDELISLIEKPPPDQDHCTDPVFESTQKRLWSCDRKSFTDAWYVSAELGFVAGQAFDAYYHVRGVRTI